MEDQPVRGRALGQQRHAGLPARLPRGHGRGPPRQRRRFRWRDRRRHAGLAQRDQRDLACGGLMSPTVAMHIVTWAAIIILFFGLAAVLREVRLLRGALLRSSDGYTSTAPDI